jgi:hypothetical protein
MIRVIRLIEYTYDTTERMVQDRWRWTAQHSSPGMQMRSVELPPDAVR